MTRTLLPRALWAGFLFAAVACGRNAMLLDGQGDAAAQHPGSGGALHGTGGAGGGAAGVTSIASGGIIGTGGLSARGGAGGSSVGGGSGGIIVIRIPDGGLPSLPDGGLPALLGDSGLLNGILDAPRDSVLGQVICGSEAKLGAPCPTTSQGCVLPSLGGACLCANGIYLCPANTTAGPQTCPTGATTGAACTAPLTTCVGGGAAACICGLGTYTCF